MSGSAARRLGPWLALPLVAGCTRSPEASKPVEFPVFTDVARESGLSFQHDDGHDGKNYRVVETLAGGVALIDFDGDGWIDIFFTNGLKIDPGKDPPRCALVRNQGDGTFRDVSREARLDRPAFSLGASVADVDGDGDPDLHVTNLGANWLLRNDGGGAFTDIAAAAGVAGGGMSTGSAFLDMDHDGDLDLYVASYVIDDGTRLAPYLARGVPGYWPPRNYPAAPHHLYRNQGDGTFQDVSVASGIRDAGPGRGLGVVSSDFNLDGHPDIYVANDKSENFMFLGDGTGRFANAAPLNGTALSEEGAELGSMGVAVADYDQDGRFDLCVTNYQDEVNNLYRAAGPEIYEDMARGSGICQGRLREVSWGVGFPDLDCDGRPDLIIVNGHLNPFTHQLDEGTSYQQPKEVFRNLGGGRFERISHPADDCIGAPRVCRGAAFGDLDNDGDVDVVVLDSRGPPELLRNDGGNRNAWCLVLLRGSGKNRDAIGARVTLTAGGLTQVAERRSSGSYLSSNDPRLHFGLGAAQKIDRLEVRWPDGRVDSYRDLPARRRLTIEEGAKEVRAEEMGRQGAAGKH
jgi:enediyne biosynthesis protein E4